MYSSRGPKSAENRGLRTLIVDTSPQVREHLISLVAHLDRIEVAGQAGGVVEALEAIPRLNPDIIIMDLFTPGGSLETLQQIKSLSPDSIIVMLAFYPYSRYRDQCILAGADYVLDKLTEVKKVGEVLASLV